MEDSEKCLHLKASKSQREEERARGLEDGGTSGYKNMGCYNCDELQKDCISYLYRRRNTK